MADVMKNDKSWNPPPIGSNKRQEMPAHAFLLPSQKKYPYKKYVNGEWKISCAGLLAAYRRAIMNGYTEVSQKAKNIAKRSGCSWANKDED
ncbi:MAG: hypothetical protein ACP5KD_08905 [Fervidobacterium sp.]